MSPTGHVRNPTLPPCRSPLDIARPSYHRPLSQGLAVAILGSARVTSSSSEGSEYFKKLVALDGTAKPPTDGCKVIRVGDDFATAEQVSEVLQLLYGKRVLPIYSLGDSDSFVALLEFLKLAASFGLWSHFFAALQPFFAEYRDRLTAFHLWDGMRDISSPRNAIYMLNTVYAAQSLLERYAVGFAAEGDRETHIAMQILQSGCRLDLSLFLTDEEIRDAPEPDPKVLVFLQRPGVLGVEDSSTCRDLRHLHHTHAERLRSTLASFESLEEPPSHHIRCCGDATRRLFTRLWAVCTLRGTRLRSTIFLDLVRGLHTDSGRIDICDECLSDLDAVVSQAYNEWWTSLSSHIYGIKLVMS